MYQRVLALVAVTLGTSLMVGGCASQPSRFYLLSSSPNTEMASLGASGEQGPTIGVGPVTLPRYLDRPQIVTRTSPYELKLAEFDRWAEALDTNFSRVLAENLSLLIPASRVVIAPWLRTTPIDYQIIVEVTHFLSQLGGESLLIADWTLFKGEGQQALMSGKSRFSASTGGQDYAAIVAAMSQTVASLSREIATAIRGVGSRVSTRQGFSDRPITP
ncbi:MAG: PqiC family protein [Candidatus Entotheonellia bacterium]